MENMIFVDIWEDWILKHVVIKFGCMKMDNGGDVVKSSHANIWFIYCVLIIFQLIIWICPELMCSILSFNAFLSFGGTFGVELGNIYLFLPSNGLKKLAIRRRTNTIKKKL